MKKGFIDVLIFVGSIILILVLVVGLIVFAVFFSVHQPTEGQHTGIITAVEKNGLIWKTWRVYVKTSNQTSQEDVYCVKDQALVDQLKLASEQKKEVTIEFSVPFIVPNWDCKGETAIIHALK